MRRLIFALFAALSLLFGLSISASAQADFGSDGIDTNCSTRDFDSVEEARAYFASDGGSATRNVDDLDRNGDGIACNSGLSNDGSSGGDDSGDDGAGTDTGTGNDDSSGGPDTNGDDPDAVTGLPETGVGDVSTTTGATMALFSVVSVLALIVASVVRRTESIRN